MKTKSKIFLSGVLALLFFGSCSKDDDVSCNEIYVKIATKSQDLASTDCTVVVATYDKLIDLYEQGKDCKVISDAVKDNGYTSVDDFLADFRSLRDLEAADCN
ncbi:MAG: hypothetical protein U0U09_16970 [Cyclobacteriaceae bacterium]